MLCECGCGRETPIAERNRAERGQLKGLPVRFYPTHSSRNKGGRLLKRTGYVEVATGVRAGSAAVRYIREHIIVAERAIGKRLPLGAVVHHIDGDKANNEPSNLLICESSAYHTLLHRRLRAYRATGNPNSRRCIFCGKWGLDLLVGRTAEHPECRRAYNAAWRLRRAQTSAEVTR